MGRLRDKRFFDLLHEYLSVYLPQHKSASPHTLRAYKKALDIFLDYLKILNGCSLFDLSFVMIDRKTIQDYLLWLDKEKGLSSSTQVQRFACLKGFLKYCSETETELTKYYLFAEGLGSKRPSSGQEKIEYMSERAVRVLIEQPDLNTAKGRRDKFLMILLYDTGARVDELLNIKICDVKTGTTPTVMLYGKGRKHRSVPLSDKTLAHYKRYISEFHAHAKEQSQDYLFQSITAKENRKMSANNVRVLLKEYGLTAKKYCSEIPDNVHPHLFRHSRAMHLYQGGMDLTLVSQWLGHANLQTTLIYAHADTEQKRTAIDKATGSNNPIKQNYSYGIDPNDEETLKRLYGLR
ncbi:MAG: tyrosine-type recombinase/integrase [Ruminococcus sp.]|nr:tyrosine-type recombinase/integrase [Ruminococcus sp.]